MIFVILGTQDKVFPRLIKEVEELKKKNIIKEEVIIQNGNTKYESKYVKLLGFINSQEMTKYIKDSKYIITHGGVGSIIEALTLNKKVIAVPRLKEYKEHENNHQREIIKEFTNLGYILNGEDNLEESIKSLDNFKPKKYQSNQKNFLKVIENFIENN